MNDRRAKHELGSAVGAQVHPVVRLPRTPPSASHGHRARDVHLALVHGEPGDPMIHRRLVAPRLSILQSDVEVRKGAHIGDGAALRAKATQPARALGRRTRQPLGVGCTD